MISPGWKDIRIQLTPGPKTQVVHVDKLKLHQHRQSVQVKSPPPPVDSEMSPSIQWFSIRTSWRMVGGFGSGIVELRRKNIWHIFHRPAPITVPVVSFAAVLVVVS